MYKKRILLRVTIKLLIFVALMLLVAVFLRSLFPSLVDKSNDIQKIVKTSEINLQGMHAGEIRKVRWQGREVGILKRKNQDFGHTKYITKLPHKSLHSGARSRLLEYFVYYNQGDSGSCPLFYNAKGFKDICSGKHFDTTGREKDNEKNGVMIKIPPHYFETQKGKVTKLVIGRWKL